MDLRSETSKMTLHKCSLLVNAEHYYPDLNPVILMEPKRLKNLFFALLCESSRARSFFVPHQDDSDKFRAYSFELTVSSYELTAIYYRVISTIKSSAICSKASTKSSTLLSLIPICALALNIICPE